LTHRLDKGTASTGVFIGVWCRQLLIKIVDEDTLYQARSWRIQSLSTVSNLQDRSM
jgi:hypothetical protein